MSNIGFDSPKHPTRSCPRGSREEVCQHRWFSGRMLACHAGGPGSIPGRCNVLDANVNICQHLHMRSHLYGHYHMHVCVVRVSKKGYLPDGESNPGLPRDRRGYSPLYYRGLNIKSCEWDFEKDYEQLLCRYEMQVCHMIHLVFTSCTMTKCSN